MQPQVHNLADGGTLVYIHDFLPTDLAQRYFEELRDTAPWEQKPGVFGHKQPQLTAFRKMDVSE